MYSSAHWPNVGAALGCTVLAELVQLMCRRPSKVAAIALANKTARTAWALMVSGERYRDPQAMQAAVSATL
jgi:hypothetical protein